MPIAIQCQCGKKYKIDEAHAGKRLRCKAGNPGKRLGIIQDPNAPAIPMSRHPWMTAIHSMTAKDAVSPPSRQGR